MLKGVFDQAENVEPVKFQFEEKNMFEKKLRQLLEVENERKRAKTKVFC